MKLRQNEDWRATQIIKGRNYVDWSGHIDADIMDADRRSQLHRREARRNNSDSEPAEQHRREGRSVAMDSSASFEYEIRWPDGRSEITIAKPVRLVQV